MDVLTTRAHAVRWVAVFAALAALAWLFLHDAHGGLKGTSIPVPNLAVCVVVAATVAFLCIRAWSAMAAPVLAGVAGAFGIGGEFFGPFGGLVGLLLGLIVVLVPIPLRTHRERGR